MSTNFSAVVSVGRPVDSDPRVFDPTRPRWVVVLPAGYLVTNDDLKWTYERLGRWLRGELPALILPPGWKIEQVSGPITTPALPLLDS